MLGEDRSQSCIETFNGPRDLSKKGLVNSGSFAGPLHNIKLIHSEFREWCLYLVAGYSFHLWSRIVGDTPAFLTLSPWILKSILLWDSDIPPRPTHSRSARGAASLQWSCLAASAWYWFLVFSFLPTTFQLRIGLCNPTAFGKWARDSDAAVVTTDEHSVPGWVLAALLVYPLAVHRS